MNVFLKKKRKRTFFHLWFRQTPCCANFCEDSLKRTCRTSASTTHVVRNACVTVVRISCHDYCCL